MKKFICIFGAFTFITMSFALLFKIMHYPGAGLMLLCSFGVYLPIFIICTAIYIAKK